MIPNKLTLTGFIGIKAGMGLETITIDLDQLIDPDAMLIAIKGDNGKGKSTVLDNLHPYRLMPSRAGSYSPGSFSYYDNTYGDASKVLEWSHNGMHYRSTILIKGAGKSKKTESYLHQMGQDGWEPVPGSDGKNTTYDAALEQILGTPEMFFTAVFASQGRKPLSTYTNGDIKALLAELLGLENVQELGGKAQDVVRLLTRQLEGHQQTLLKVDEQDEIRARSNASLVALEQNQQPIQEQARTTAQGAVQAARDTLATANANTEQAASIDAQRAQISQELTGCRTQMDSRVAEVRTDMTRVNGERTQADTGHRNKLSQIADIERVHNDTITNSNAIIDQKPAIDEAVANMVTYEGNVISAQAGVDLVNEKISANNILKADAALLLAEGNTIKQEGIALADRLEDLKKKSGLCDAVPCHAQVGLQESCSLLADARQAADQLPDITAQTDAKRAAYADIKAKRDTITLKIDDCLVAHLTAANTELTAAQAVLANAKAMAAKADDLGTAMASINKAEIALDECHVNQKAATESHAKVIQDIESRTQELDARIITIQSDANERIIGLQQQMEALPVVDASVSAIAQHAVTEADEQLRIAEQALDSTKQAIATAKAAISAAEQALADLDGARKEAAAIEAELPHWRMLSKALGADGIIALSIDDAGPSIAAICNDLLTSCYGPRFTVSIETQAETKKGTQKETFDIMVLDAQQDEKKSIRSMSGGERVWINEALTRSIALFQAQQSGQQYECLFADESDGALDPERKIMFMAMKKAVLELGGYKREIMITHTPELLDFVDVVIDLNQFVEVEA